MEILLCRKPMNSSPKLFSSPPPLPKNNTELRKIKHGIKRNIHHYRNITSSILSGRGYEESRPAGLKESGYNLSRPMEKSVEEMAAPEWIQHSCSTSELIRHPRFAPEWIRHSRFAPEWIRHPLNGENIGLKTWIMMMMSFYKWITHRDAPCSIHNVNQYPCNFIFSPNSNDIVQRMVYIEVVGRNMFGKAFIHLGRKNSCWYKTSFDPQRHHFTGFILVVTTWCR